MTKTPQPDIVAQAVQRQTELFAAVEALLFGKAAKGETIDSFSSGELLLCSSLSWDRKRTATELGQRSAIWGMQQQAGSSADRREAQERLEAARDKLAAEGPKLREELARVTSELNGEITAMEQAVAEANQKVDSQNAAVTYLQKWLPPHVIPAADRAVDAVNRQHGQTISQLQLSIDRIVNLAKIKPVDLEGKQAAIRYAEASGHRDLLLARQNDRNQHEVNVTAWRSHVSELQATLPELRKKLETAKAEQAAALVEAQSARNFYVPA